MFSVLSVFPQQTLQRVKDDGIGCVDTELLQLVEVYMWEYYLAVAQTCMQGKTLVFAVSRLPERFHNPSHKLALAQFLNWKITAYQPSQLPSRRLSVASLLHISSGMKGALQVFPTNILT